MLGLSAVNGAGNARSLLIARRAAWTESPVFALRREPRRSAERRARPKHFQVATSDGVARAAPAAFSDGNIREGGAAVEYAPVGAPSPSWGLFAVAWQNSDAMRIARTRSLLPHLSPQAGEGAELLPKRFALYTPRLSISE